MGPVAAAFVMLMSLGFTVNPDGSGKVVVEVTQSAPAPGGEKAAPTPEAVQQFAREVIERSKGVEAWADVSFGGKPGLMTFKGTAYFKDLGGATLARGPNGFPLSWAKDPKGGMALVVNFGEAHQLTPPVPPTLTDKELAKEIEQAERAWKNARVRLESEMAGTKTTYTFKLPGAVTDTNGLKKEADGSVVFVFDGAKVVQEINKLMADAVYVGSCIKAGLMPANDPRDPLLKEKLFGSKDLPSARVPGEMKPQFDYTAEVKAAKEAYPKMIEKLGLAPKPPVMKATKRVTDPPDPPPPGLEEKLKAMPRPAAAPK
jgi:hypothetical protein